MKGARPVSDLVAGILDPALRKKSGMSVGLVQAWADIAGGDIGERTRPLKVKWPPRGVSGEEFRPGTLVLACDQSVALKIQHQTTELISRVNAHFGFAAIDRIHIVQKPVTPWRSPERKSPRKLDEREERHIGELTQNIDDSELRNSLRKLGRAIIGESSS